MELVWSFVAPLGETGRFGADAGNVEERHSDTDRCVAVASLACSRAWLPRFDITEDISCYLDGQKIAARRAR
jgi:hypothetical protein